jgi:hypothetical protein
MEPISQDTAIAKTLYTSGTAGEKILGCPFKYAEIPDHLYGKPLGCNQLRSGTMYRMVIHEWTIGHGIPKVDIELSARCVGVTDNDIGVELDYGDEYNHCYYGPKYMFQCSATEGLDTINGKYGVLYNLMKMSPSQTLEEVVWGMDGTRTTRNKCSIYRI